jgi:hypothetical protein
VFPRRTILEKKEPQLPVRNLGFITLAMSYSRTTYRCTTIGAAAFHFRVRNGNGWDHCARITRKLAKSKLARGGNGGGLTLNFTRKSDDQNDWECGQRLRADMGKQKLTTQVQHWERRERRQRK